MKRRLTAEDLSKVRYISEPQISPDARQISYVITAVDTAQDRSVSTIYIHSPGTGERALVGRGTRPRWTSGGESLMYLHLGQVRSWERDGSGRTLTAPDMGAKSFALSPGGRHLLISSDVELPLEPVAPASGLHFINRIRYKLDNEGYVYRARRQLSLVDLRTGRTQRLTDEAYGVEDVIWSRDGDSIAYVTGAEDPDFSWRRRIMMLSVKGGSPGAVCEAVGIQDLSWSPDGRHIAFRATSVDPYNPSASFGLWVVPATGGEPVEITAGFDGFVGNDRLVSDVMRNRVSQRAVWSADSRNLHFLASEGGDLTLRRVALDGGPVHRMNDGIEGDRAVHSFDYCPGEDLFVAVVSSFDLPGDLWLLPRGERLTAVNDDWLSGLELSTGERLSWNSYDGTGIEGWILKPPGFDESRDYPAILSIHGGPYRHYGAVFFFEMQMLAAEGYVVFCPNPRGSHGYGQAFAGAIYDDWGNLDYHDLMSGVDCLLTLGFVDENRLGVTGGSYGGYMTNWIITQTPRFKAAIADRSVSNLHSLLGTDIQYSLWESPSGDAWEWDGIMHALMRSPLTHADRVKTPLLLIHPTDDQCCPIEQAEQFYTALKRLGSAVELLLFPGASHELPRSGNLTQRVQRLQWITAWFNEQLTDSDDS